MTENQSKKVIIVGNTSIGKTALLLRMVSDIWLETIPTVASNFNILEKKINGKEYNAHIYDTAGAERYRSLTMLYIRDTRVALICFSRNDPNPIESIKTWKQLIEEEQEGVKYIYVRTMDDDIKEGNEINDEEKLDDEQVQNNAISVQNYIKECNESVEDFLITSSLTKYGIQELTNKICLSVGPVESNQQKKLLPSLSKDCCK